MAARGADVLSSLSSVLSEHASSALGRAGLKRDSKKTCAPERLAEMLAERGLPIWDPLLDLQRALGGVVVPGGKILGTFAALSTFERRVRLSVARLLRYGGQVLMPISNEGGTEFWMDAQGTIYLVFPDDDFCTPTDTSYVLWLERLAFIEEHSVNRKPPVRPFGAIAWALVGEPVARALALPRFSPACDRFGDAWYREDAFVEELRIPRYHRDTRIRAETIDDVIVALDAIVAHAPDATIDWGGPRGGPLQEGEPVARRYTRYPAEGPSMGEIVVIGTPGSYRVFRS